MAINTPIIPMKIVHSEEKGTIKIDFQHPMHINFTW